MTPVQNRFTVVVSCSLWHSTTNPLRVQYSVATVMNPIAAYSSRQIPITKFKTISRTG